MPNIQPPPMPPPKPAKFAGRCGGCPHQIKADEPIVWVRGIGTRCMACCVRIWGIVARVHFGLPPSYTPPVTAPTKPVDPVDRPITPDEYGKIDVKPRRGPPKPEQVQTEQPRRARTYEELFGPDE